MIRILISLGLLLGAVAPVAAQDVKCDPGGNQLELNACADNEFKQADAELNAVYRQIVAKLAGEPVALAKMKAAQRLWVQLRDADLDARYPVGDDENPRLLYGSMYPMLYSGAKAALTTARVTYLRNEFLERSEYDL